MSLRRLRSQGCLHFSTGNSYFNAILFIDDSERRLLNHGILLKPPRYRHKGHLIISQTLLMQTILALHSSLPQSSVWSHQTLACEGPLCLLVMGKHFFHGAQNSINLIFIANGQFSLYTQQPISDFVWSQSIYAAICVVLVKTQ